MLIELDNIRNWLRQRYRDYEPDSDPIKGTYGIVWFLHSTRRSLHPSVFAVKTIKPDLAAAIVRPGQEQIDILHREFRLWLGVPHSINVVPALGLDFAPVFDHYGRQLPFMRMPKYDGSLLEWVGPKAPLLVDRIIGLAQAFNGLLYLYGQGLEGHGDLKPDNLLFDDLTKRYALPKTGVWPSTIHPWRVSVGDLGWADVWKDLGLTTKASRPYVAPERFSVGGSGFVPRQSDVFSMGVVASMVLQGRHPAPNLDQLLRSEGKYFRWVKEGLRDIDNIEPPSVRELVSQCLDFDPQSRPTPTACLSALCESIRADFGIEIEGTLELWRHPADRGLLSADQHATWAALTGGSLNLFQQDVSVAHLESRLAAVHVVDIPSCERWAELARGLVLLLQRREDEKAQTRVLEVRSIAREHFEGVIATVGRAALETLGGGGDATSRVRPFERLQSLISEIAWVAGLAYGQNAEAGTKLSALARSAWAFAEASRRRQGDSEFEPVEDLLRDAIHLQPDEATLYYFRAFWRYTSHLLATGTTGLSPPVMALLVEDVQAAIKLAPEWDEPNNLMQSLAATS